MNVSNECLDLGSLCKNWSATQKIQSVKSALGHFRMMCCALIFSWALLSAFSVATASERILIDNVNVVDVRNGKVIPDRSIVIEGGRISRIAEAGLTL